MMDSALKLLRSPAVLMVTGVVATSILALGVVIMLLRAGGAKAVTDNAALIGALVALGGVFTAQMVSIAIDARHTHEARDLEAQRAQEAALQNYFEQVGTLLIEQPLLRARPGEKLSTVVRAHTLAVLENLDPVRKRILLQFLYESGLIHKERVVVSLLLADFTKAYLHIANLSNAYLRFANLRNTVLSDAMLSGTVLSDAILSESDLSGADMTEAVLDGAILTGANLSDADLSNVDLSGAILGGANLSNAILHGALLFGAHLNGANLNGAQLNGAYLSGATGITTEELEQQALSLEGATMPDESVHP